MRENNTCSTNREGEVIQDFYYNATDEQRTKGQVVKGCSCNLSAKTVCTTCQCPRGMWLSQEEELKDKK